MRAGCVETGGTEAIHAVIQGVHHASSSNGIETRTTGSLISTNLLAPTSSLNKKKLPVMAIMTVPTFPEMPNDLLNLIVYKMEENQHENGRALGEPWRHSALPGAVFMRSKDA